MPKIVIAEVRSELDGEYDFDGSSFTNFELHAIKKLTDLTAGAIGDAFEHLDNDVIVAIGMVALMREGKISGRTPWNSAEVSALWDAKVGSIFVTEDETEVDADPPVIAPDEPEQLAASVLSNGASGATSSLDSDLPDKFQSLTGDPT